MLRKLLLTVLISFFATSAFADNTTRRFLLNTLSSRAPLAVQVNAIKVLKEEVGNSEIERTLLSIVKNTTIASELRQEALKSLVPVSRSNTVTRTLTTLFTREQDLDVKVVLVKSLWLAAASDHKLRRFLTNILLRDTDVELRKAAAFALQATINSSSSASPLLNVARNSSLDSDLRVEALKSLFFYNSSSVDRFLQQLSYNEGEDTPVRVASLKLLAGYPLSSSKRRFLMNLAQMTSDDSVRIAATDALRIKLSQEDVRYFHLFKNPKTGDLRDPLLD
jgi:hypothetical protein